MTTNNIDIKQNMLELFEIRQKILLKKILKSVKKLKRHFQCKFFKKPETNRIMFDLMQCCLWLRIDLELLLRAAYWQNLTKHELGARVIGDQNFLEQTLKRLCAEEIEINKAKALNQQVMDQNNTTSTTPENNSDIIKNLAYRKKELNDAWASYHKILSKFAHPDPYFCFFPEKYIYQIEKNLINILSTCLNTLNFEWTLLKQHLEMNC